MSKKIATEVKGLRLLLIGQVLILLGVLNELNFINKLFSLISIVAFVGLILLLIGVTILAKTNKLFLMSFLCILFTLITSTVATVFVFVGVDGDARNNYNTIISLISKLVSILFTFGIIRGCSKAALGKAMTHFSDTMSVVNFACKLATFGLALFKDYIYPEDPTVVGIISIISLVISLGCEFFFCVYLFRAYKMAKGKLKIHKKVTFSRAS